MSLSSIDTNIFLNSLTYKTTFLTAQILICLRSVKAHELKDRQSKNDLTAIKDKGAIFLMEEKSKKNSYNYWAKKSHEKNIQICPDDLDDTFSALSALFHCNSSNIKNADLEDIIKILQYCDSGNGGPFKTWIVAKDLPKKWQDVDIIVNATIAYFLSLINEHLPNLEKYISNSIREGKYNSLYYPDLYQRVYFLSRFYKSQKKFDNDIKNILSGIVLDATKTDNPSTNLLQKALLLSSLINIGEHNDVIISQYAELIHEIENNGFKPYGFSRDPSRNGIPSFAGSSALTAAFCLEAIMEYTHYFAQAKNENSVIHSYIQNIARENMRVVGLELETTVLEQINKTSDPKITYIVYEIEKILNARGIIVPQKLVQQLALANLCGWISYRIYDDILDRENITPYLPCANLFLRNLSAIYYEIDIYLPGSKTIFTSMMDRLESANAWEQKYCRFLPLIKDIYIPEIPDYGDYKKISDRSLGYAIGPLILLHHSGYSPGSKESAITLRIFENYLIARQISDDAHDWKTIC